MSSAVGIDLGTTFSLVATVARSRPRIIADQGERLIPSVVGVSPKGELLVGGSTRIPLVRRLLAEHLGQEPLSAVHPDESVALGAATQAAIIAGEPIEAVLVDVAPHSLGIETMGVMLGHLLPDRYTVLIPRNTAIPCTRAESFYTLTPDQDRARVRVYQGEEAVASRNTPLGEFVFEGISPAPGGENREVVVRFDYDVDGLVHVLATDRRTNRRESIKVRSTREQLSEVEKARSREKVGAFDRRLEREIDALLRRAERLMTRLEADGEQALAESLLELAGDLERARQERDYDQTRELAGALSGLVYQHER